MVIVVEGGVKFVVVEVDVVVDGVGKVVKEVVVVVGVVEEGR